MAEFKKVLGASVGGGVLLMGAAGVKAQTTVTMSAAPATNSPVLAGSEINLAHYYGTGTSYTDSSANYTPAAGTPTFPSGQTDPTYGLNTFVSAQADYAAGDVHGNPYLIGQSFSTGSSGYKLNQIGVAFGDSDNSTLFDTQSETLHLFKIDSSTGKLSSVGTYTAGGTAITAVAGIKNTNFTFVNGPTLSANTTYAFTITEGNLVATSLIIPKAVSNSAFGNPGGTASQQLVEVNSVASSGENSFLSYSGYTSRNNNYGQAANSPAETGTDYYIDNTTTRITPVASTGGNPSNPARPSASIAALIPTALTKSIFTWSHPRCRSRPHSDS